MTIICLNDDLSLSLTWQIYSEGFILFTEINQILLLPFTNLVALYQNTDKLNLTNNCHYYLFEGLYFLEFVMPYTRWDTRHPKCDFPRTVYIFFCILYTNCTLLILRTDANANLFDKFYLQCIGSSQKKCYTISILLPWEEFWTPHPKNSSAICEKP